MTALEAAIHYAQMGWRVFPVWGRQRDGTCRCGEAACSSPGKHPIGHLVHKGHKDATQDIRKLKEWWPAGSENGIAIATGPDFWVLDEDEVGAADDLALPATRVARTPSGGRHFYFQGNGVANSTKRIRGCDTRGTGGYVVAPPTPGYVWVDERDMAAAPESLLTALARPAGGHRVGGGAALAYADGARRQEVARVRSAQKGTRNDTLNAAAFNLGQLSPPLDPSEVVHELVDAATETGLGKIAAERTAKSGFTAGQQKPRGGAVETAEDWEPPAPLPGDEPPPPFPVHAFPPWLRSWVEAIAEATQTPMDLAGLLSIAVLACACAKKLVARIKPDWVEPVNVYVMVVLPPGERKSAVFRLATVPIFEFQRSERERQEPARRKALERVDVLRGQLKNLKRDAAKADDQERQNLLTQIDETVKALDAAERATPALLRLYADDVTPERVTGLLTEQGGRLAVLSAEGDLFEVLGGRYTQGGVNIGVFLKGHAGDSITVDRVQRPSEYVHSPALTLALTVQPSVLRNLPRKKGFRGQGLLARFAYAVPVSPLGQREVDPPSVPQSTVTGYDWYVRDLLALEATQDERGEYEPREITFAVDARRRLQAYQAALEPRLGPEGDLIGISDWASKLTGLVARIAVLLTAADRIPGGAAGVGAEPVAVDAVERATVLGDYLLAHALRAFGEMQLDPATHDARIVLRWLARQDPGRLSARDIFNGTRRTCPTMKDLEPVLELLVEHGYLRPVTATRTQGPGRPPSTKYDVNPLWDVRTNRRMGS